MVLRMESNPDKLGGRRVLSPLHKLSGLSKKVVVVLDEKKKK